MKTLKRDNSLAISRRYIDEEFIATDDFDGPNKKRDCTDIIFTFLLIASWIVMTLIGFAAVGIIQSDIIDKGDPKRLIRGVDYMGKICGVDDPVKHLGNKWEPNTFFFNPDSNGDYVPQEYGICVESCPVKNERRYDPYDDTSSRYWKAIGDVSLSAY